jgi:uncharacterized protein YjiS (DUF1127 family)
MIAKHVQSAADAGFGLHGEETGSLFAKAQSLVASAFKRVSKEAEAQQAIWELSQLDDHALRDIGISRAEIQALVRGQK